MEAQVEYISFKKVLMFGDQGTGKSTLSNLLEKEKFLEDIPKTKNG